MKKRRVYIFFTVGYTGVAGTEMYTAGKAKYLEKNGWEVYVCSAECNNYGECKIPSLTKYLKTGGGWFFFKTPPYKMNKYDREIILNSMVERLNLTDYKNCEIIIESHLSSNGCWAELLAYRVKARHFAIAPHEDFDFDTYKDNLDFFYFKWKRNELVASEAAITRLFNGYKNVTKTLVDMPDTVREQPPILDVEIKDFDSIAKLDWNICYIGRTNKIFVPAMISGISELAKHYPDKKIHFMVIGHGYDRLELMKKEFSGLTNIKLTLFGVMSPIPRILFSKIDVVLAGAQSAVFAADEGVLTITADAETDRTPGVLGYDTQDAWYGSKEKSFSYFEVLENVLVKRLYDNKIYDMPELKPVDYYYDNFWTIVKNADKKKEYYNEPLSQDRTRNWVAIFPFGIIPKGARIILCGATEIRKDYIKQVEGQQYGQIITTVDEHDEEFDNSVQSLERLRNIDYDCIVISTFPQNAQETYNKILQVVPQMQGRIIYNFQIGNT